METNPAMALGGGSRILLGLTKKRTDRNRSYLNRIAPPRLPLLSSIPPRAPKIRKLGCNNSRRAFRRKFHGNILFRRYSSLMNSGLPKRVMFRQGGQWIDFCEDITSVVRKEFQLKRTAVLVEKNCGNILLDFLNMIHVDSQTGLQRPVAWIDEAGSCFFPEIFNDSDDEFCCADDDYDNEVIVDSNGPKKIRPQPMLIEGSGESNSVVHGFEYSGTSDVKYDFESDSCEVKQNMTNGNFAAENRQIGNTTGPGLDNKLVRRMFVHGMGSSTDVNIIEISRVNNKSTNGRWEIFQKQAEITTKYRGDANVRFVWLPSSKESLSKISVYGMGNFEHQSNLAAYGIGFHLSPVNFSRISAGNCDVDENGICYLVLCRVILGKMELVSVGSKQFHPSSEHFDTGVDSLTNPRCHVVWNIYSNTHIFPEYIVSFKSPSYFKGVATLEIPTQKLDSRASYVVKQEVERGEAAVEGGAPCVPKSPWISFAVLFEAIKGVVPPNTLSSVYTSYTNFRDKKMDRVEFVRELRMIVGDPLLKSTLQRFQLKAPASEPDPDCSRSSNVST